MSDKDTIYRQAAIDAIANSVSEIGLHDNSEVARYGATFRQHEIIDIIEGLPSAQPEIIRCTECKHYREYDSEYVKNAVVVQCMADRYPISEIIPDGWFCAGAERKDDE